MLVDREIVINFVSNLINNKLDNENINTFKDIKKVVIKKIVRDMLKKYADEHNMNELEKRIYYNPRKISPELWRSLKECIKDREYQKWSNDYIKGEVKRWSNLINN